LEKNGAKEEDEIEEEERLLRKKVQSARLMVKA
jgi:hypothetical protein